MAKLWELDPLTGIRIRAARATDRRYERDTPGDMIHIDVKKLGRIPDGGGWRADPNQSARNHNTGHTKVGFDYVHVAVDDHSRLAFVEVHPDEKGPTCAGFLERAAAFMASHGSNQARTDALQPWLDFYNHQRPHGSLGGKAPITRCN